MKEKKEWKKKRKKEKEREEEENGRKNEKKEPCFELCLGTDNTNYTNNISFFFHSLKQWLGAY